MTDYKKATSVADMKANFPTIPPGVIGKPNLKELIRILQYIMMCAQTHKSSISPDMNLLYLVVPPEIYAQYTQEEHSIQHYPTPTNVPLCTTMPWPKRTMIVPASQPNTPLL